MTHTLRILLKPTGEHFNVPYEAQTTIYDLIKYVCTHTTVISNTHPDDYYLSINNSDTLDGNRTVKEAGLDQPNKCVSLDMYVKTAVLCQRISQSRAKFWQTSAKQIPQKSQQTTAIDISADTGMIRETTVDLQKSCKLITISSVLSLYRIILLNTF